MENAPRNTERYMFTLVSDRSSIGLIFAESTLVPDCLSIVLAQSAAPTVDVNPNARPANGMRPNARETAPNLILLKSVLASER